MRKALLFLVLICTILTAWSKPVAAGDLLVRVAVLRDMERFTLSINGTYKVIDPISGAVLFEGNRFLTVPVTIHNGTIKVGDHQLDVSRILIEPRRSGTLAVNGRYYRGTLTVFKDAALLSVVNNVDLEQYVRGVLYHEISDRWPIEAIKAQAVATRSFAVYSMGKFSGRDYDMTSDVYSQVYGGREAERYRTNLAVRRTNGEVLTYEGRVFPSFFHANSGGITESASELWGIDIPPLRGGVKSVFSVDAPSYKWIRNFRLKDIQDKLIGNGRPIGLIKEIKVVERNKTGRVRKLSVLDRDGKLITVDGKFFRDMLGVNIIRSNLYDVIMKGWYVDFSGYGWGHGVGMCQWGAYGMAKMRYDYRQILDFYYPSSKVERIENIKDSLSAPATSNLRETGTLSNSHQSISAQ